MLNRHTLQSQNDIKDSKLFEIVLDIKDSQGNPTGKRKSYSSDDPYKIWKFWMQYQGKPKRRKKKTSPDKLPSATQADKILKDLYNGKKETNI